MSRIHGSLRALLSRLVDYAGLYPPAALPLPLVIEKYRGLLASPESWILNRLVLPLDKVSEVRPEPDWRITVLVDADPGPLPPQVETLETKSGGTFPLPSYHEMDLDQITAGYAKLRTGGVTPESIPASETVAAYLCRAAARRLPFKATAGLHHAIRSEHPLTYEPQSPRAVMHGFLNVFVAAAFAWQGMSEDVVLEILNETDPAAFCFLENELRWRGSGLSTEQVEASRRHFAHSFGSCSFEEPLGDLRELGLL